MKAIVEKEQYIRLSLDVSKSRADNGATYIDGSDEYWRDVCVDSCGEVWASDEVSGNLSRHHDLTTENESEARRLAGLVR